MAKFSLLAFLAALAAAYSTTGHAMEPYYGPYNVTLADGTTVEVHMVGSEDDPYEHDSEGYALVPTEVDTPNGGILVDYQFAEIDSATGDLKASGITANDPNGHKKMKQKGVAKGIKRSAAAKGLLAKGGTGSAFAPKENRNGQGRGPARKLNHIDHYEQWNEEVEDFHRRQLAMDWSGTKKNLVIPMIFSNHHVNGVPSRWLPKKSDLEILFNSDGIDANYAPTGSVKKVFADTSYGKLNLVSDIVDWIPLDYTEAYYANGSRGFTTVMHQAMRHALDKLEAKGFDFSPYDTDNDGLIDAICFLHSGYAAEWGGTSEDGASYLNRIWSHKWSLYSFRHPSTANGSGWTSNKTTSSGKAVRVYNYHISPAVYGTFPGSKAIKDKMGRIGVIAHETGHFLGITDLYDTAGDGGNGIGSWDLMANSWGFRNDQYYPPIMSPWSKMELGWLNPTEIASSGTYDLLPSYDSQEVYKISTGFANDEFLLIEYRKAMGFEAMLGYPSGSYPTYAIEGGLAIWHIDNKAGYDHQGWPGQVGWPANGKHYRIALLAADGLYELEKYVDRGDGGDLFVPGIVDSLGPSGTSAGRPYPNTDSYQGGNIIPTGIAINNIKFKQSGKKMSFDIVVPVQPTSSPTKSPTLAPITPTTSPTVSPTNHPTAFPTISPTLPSTESPTRAPSVSTLTCTGTDRLFSLVVDAPSKASNLSWIVEDVANAQVRVLSPSYEDATEPKQYIHEYCLPQAGCYKFDLYDVGGGGVSHHASFDGELVAESNGNAAFLVNGGDFGTSCDLASAGRTADSLGSSGASLSNGIMFDLQANKDNDLLLFRFTSLHLASGTHSFKVFTKNGSYKGYESDASAWTEVQSVSGLPGGGQGVFTNTGANITPFVPILSETVQAFYIVMGSRSMYYSTDTVAEGDLFKSFGKFKAFSGTTCTSSTEFEGCETGVVAGFEGRIHTGFVEVYSTFAPTGAPVDVTTSPHTSHPTTAATSNPTEAPIVCSEGKKKLKIELQTDDEADELSWEVIDVYNNGNVAGSGGQYAASAQYIRKEICLDDSGCYKFLIYDSAGDGISGNGNGVTVTYDDVVEMVPVSGYNPAFSVDGVDFGSMCLPSGGGLVTMGNGGTEVANGNMFDIQATQDIMIRRFSFLNIADTGTYGYKVYSKNGSYRGHENDSTKWTLVHDGNIMGAGAGSYTAADNFSVGTVPVLSGTTQAFYVVLDQPKLVYYKSDVLVEGDVYMTFGVLDIKTGISKGGLFSSSSTGTACLDGKITYAPARLVASGNEGLNESGLDNDLPDDELIEDLGEIPNGRVKEEKEQRNGNSNSNSNGNVEGNPKLRNMRKI